MTELRDLLRPESDLAAGTPAPDSFIGVRPPIGGRPVDETRNMWIIIQEYDGAL